MRPLRGSLWCCALAVLAIGSGTAHAAWDNVFQVCCHSCRNNAAPPAVARYEPVAVVAQACPQQPCQQCTTRYEQRSYYQPVTVMQPYTYTEAVVTNRTSYYWEPVTSYHYSSYYDPNSCSCHKVATPTISYSLKTQCCPVTNYVERTALRPVTTQQLVTYYQPITSCCQTTLGAPVSTLPAGASVQPAAGDQTNPPPAVGPPGANDHIADPRDGNTSRKNNRFEEPAPRTMPRATDDSSFRSPQLQTPVVPTSPNPAPTVPTVPARIDRIAQLPAQEVAGQVLTTKSQPHAGARVLLVNKDRETDRQTATADEQGKFHVRLPSGSWLVYVRDAEGTAVYQDVLEVRGEAAAQPFVLTSR